MPAYGAASAGTRRVGKSRKEAAKRRKQGDQTQEVEVQKRIMEHFDQFDQDSSGQLDCKELGVVMKLLNDNEDVTQDDLDLVLKKADKNADGQISKDEFTKAITVWYTECQEEEKSGCCVVS